VISHEPVFCEKSFSVEGKPFKNVGHVSAQIKAPFKEMKLSKELARRAAVATCEAEINIYSYAEGSWILLRVPPKNMTVKAIDEDQGIADIRLAMKEDYSTATEKIRYMGLLAGTGLSNIKHFSDFSRITREISKSTHLKMITNID
jgi:anti-sigma regulatory factor (Ser/Thr protein kinase)